MSTLRVSNIEAKADASSPSVNEKVKITNSNGDVLVTVNGETAGITTIFTALSLGTGTSISSPATNALTLGTNNAETLRITSSGNIGIGTDNPSHKLDVVGNTQLYGTIIVGDGTNISPSGSSTGQLKIDADGYTPYIAADATAMHIGHNSSLRDLRLQTNETDRLTITADGDVGIGTDNPDVYSLGGNHRYAAIQASAGYTVLNLVDSNNSGSYLQYGNSSVRRGSLHFNSDSDFIITSNASNSGTTLTERFRIDSAGRVSRPYQLWIAGSPRNTTGSGIANAFSTSAFASPVGLAFSTDRITVPIAGVYLITFCTITDNVTTREDAGILINGSSTLETLNTPSTVNGYHYRGASISVKLAANDYIQFDNDDWYSVTQNNTSWRTASVYLLG